ncbi:hypothetical protein MTO96_003096 [Rhipicephalus appendiculatus]
MLPLGRVLAYPVLTGKTCRSFLCAGTCAAAASTSSRRSPPSGAPVFSVARAACGFCRRRTCTRRRRRGGSPVRGEPLGHASSVAIHATELPPPPGLCRRRESPRE